MKIDERVLRDAGVVVLAAVAPYTALVIFATLFMGWWAIVPAAGLMFASATWYRKDRRAASRVRAFLEAAKAKDVLR